MQYRTLGKTGLEISTLGYGASPLGGVFRDVDASIGIRTVHTALDAGINLIDCSPYYGLTRAETVLGKALKGIERERYFISTKAGRYGAQPSDFDMSAKRIRQSLDESLVRLGVDEVDIFLLHDIEFVDLDIVLHEALPCLERLKAEGRIRAFGVTGYPLRSFAQVIEGFDIDCILTYCRYALHDRSLERLMPQLEARNIGIINGSPTCMGLLTERGAPDWHPADAALRECARRATELCRERGVDITRIALQFAVQHPLIASTLVGTANPDNLLKNLQWIDEPLDQALATELSALFAAQPGAVWPSGLPQNSDEVAA
uniref:aldo/keto reductase n=1 Tax=Marinobacterium profundum TaxID=1714300 RepID=UPI00082A8EC6|nr:aldo/keto reductase [Marinobacterium profundum]